MAAVCVNGWRLSITGFIFPGLISSQKVVNTGLHRRVRLLLPSFNVHADHDQPQGQQQFRRAGHQNVGSRRAWKEGERKAAKLSIW